VPYYWSNIPSSPPSPRRNEVEQTCSDNGARLCEAEIFYRQAGNDCWALIEVQDGYDPGPLMKALGATHWIGLLNSGEKAAGKQPPQGSPQAPPSS
jgi:hypothetical protein